jgi:hypothetical protein
MRQGNSEWYPYHGKSDGAVCDKVVVQARQVRATSVQELKRRLHVDTERMSALDHAHNLLLCLLEQLLLHLQVLDDRRRIADAGERGDVVQRRLVRERALRGAVQEALVCLVERHGAESRKCCILLNAV